MQVIQTILIVLGILLITIGILWNFSSKFIPFGKLPGDFTYKGENFKFYFPFTTSVLISIILSLIILIILKLR